MSQEIKKKERNMQTYMPQLISIIVVLGFAVLVCFLCEGDIPEENKDILNILVGTFAGAFGQVIAYWIGSSRSSSVKDDLLFKSKPAYEDEE